MKDPRFRRQSGLTLIELMIAITISLLILAALTYTFVTSSRARDEIARANQQIENGRYAMQALTDDLRLAGYYGGYDPRPMANPAALPDPCVTTLSDMKAALALHVQGFDNGGLTAPCIAALTNYKAGTDVLVVRRVSTCIPGTTDCNGLTGHYYFQASYCSDELDAAIATGNQDGNAFVLANNANNTFPAATFSRTRLDCATPAVSRRFLTHIYYIDNGTYTNSDGAVVPTLVRAELKGGNFTFKLPIAEGVEELEIRYREADGDYITPSTAADWRTVMSAEVNLLARSAEPSPGHVDDKTYRLGLDSFRPTGNYKRHAFQANVHLTNPAGLY